MAIGKRETLGLVAAFLAHDLEEWFTIGPWSRDHARRDGGPTRWMGPRWLRSGVSDGHVHVGIALMGVYVACAAIAGAATRGRSRLFQTVIAAFGLHGFGHLALSAGFRGYTPGAATSPTVVIPFSAWAWRALARSGVLRSPARTIIDAAILLPVAVAATHAIAAALTRPARTENQEPLPLGRFEGNMRKSNTRLYR